MRVGLVLRSTEIKPLFRDLFHTYVCMLLKFLTSVFTTTACLACSFGLPPASPLDPIGEVSLGGGVDKSLTHSLTHNPVSG